MVYLSLDFLVSTHKQQQDSQNPKGEFKKKKEDGDHVHMVAWQREEPYRNVRLRRGAEHTDTP